MKHFIHCVGIVKFCFIDLQAGIVVEEFFSFMVLVNYVIPISLYVTVGKLSPGPFFSNFVNIWNKSWLL